MEAQPPTPLKAAPLGKTGLSVSPLGLGTVKFGRATGVKYPTAVRIPDDAAAAALLAQAQELGINLIDTAPAYGTSEARLGGLLKGQRDRWVLCTKVGEVFENDQSHFDFSPAAIAASVERSLTRLATDVLDIVLVHSDGIIERDMVSTQVLPTLARLRDAGKIRAIGASTKTVPGAIDALEYCDVLMLTLNPEHFHDLPVIAMAHERGVGVLIKKVFGSGHLAKTPQGQQECLSLALGTPGVGCVIVGTTDPHHLAANAAAAGSIPRP